MLGTQLGKVEASAEAAANHQGLWRGDISAAVMPLRLQLDSVALALDDLREGLASKASGAEEQLADARAALEGSLHELQATMTEHPSLWEAAIAEAVGPLRTQLAALEGQQGAGGQQLVGLEERLVGLEEQAASLGTVIAAAQAALAEQPWEAAVAGVAQQLRALQGEHAETTAALASMQHSVESMAEGATAVARADTELRAAIEGCPWQEDMSDAMGPPAAQLADAQEQQAAAAKAMEIHMAGIQSQVASADAAIAALKSVLDDQHEASTEIAGETRGALKAVAAQVDAVEASIASLHNELQLQPGRWEAAVADAAQPLKRQLAALSEQQEGTSGAMSVLQEAVATVAGRVNGAQTAIHALQVRANDFLQICICRAGPAHLRCFTFGAVA